MARILGFLCTSFLLVGIICGCAQTEVPNGVDKTGMIYTEVGEFDVLSLCAEWPWLS